MTLLVQIRGQRAVFKQSTRYTIKSKTSSQVGSTVQCRELESKLHF